MGLTYNGKKYLYLRNPQSFKSHSLEDNVYFTIRDVHMNEDLKSDNDFFEGVCLIDRLTNDILWQDRQEDFTYTNVLQDKLYIEGLLSWLEGINIGYFEFDDPIDEEDTIIDTDVGEIRIISYKSDYNDYDYITFEAWWENVLELKRKLVERMQSL